MIVKYGKAIWWQVAIWILICVNFLLNAINRNNPLLAVTLILLLEVLLSMAMVVSSFRTFCFSRDGLEVRLFKYRKFYRWDEIQTKRIEWYRIHHPKVPYIGAAFFCERPIIKGSWLKANLYPFHLLSYVYVMFPNPGELTAREKWFSTSYSVNQEEFVRKLSEWGVELQDNENVWLRNSE